MRRMAGVMGVRGGGLGRRRRGSCGTRLTCAACHSLERSMESICGGGCVPRVSGTRRGGGNQGTARFAHFAHFFQRKGVERGLTFFSLFFVEEKKSPTPPLGVCPSQRRANPAKATLQKTGKILKFSILSFGCRRGTGTPPRPGQGTGRAGGARTCAPVPGHHAPAEHVRVLPQGPAPALGKGHQRVLLPPPPPPR